MCEYIDVCDSAELVTCRCLILVKESGEKVYNKNKIIRDVQLRNSGF